MLILGADLGQARDPTAIAVGEVVGDELHLRHLERLALGTPYPMVIKRIGGLADALSGVTAVIDATGVGRPVLDQMREAGLDPVPVTITGGRSIIYDGAMWKVPKRSLIRPLMAALEGGRLKVARGLAEAEVLVKELQAFQRKITATGHTAFEGAAAHDDMVIAAALVTWWADLRQGGRPGTQEPKAPRRADSRLEVGKFTEVALSGDPAPRQFAQVQTARFVGPASRFLAVGRTDQGPLQTVRAIQDAGPG
jgi:hypothetical protein